jgi:hypothetical protein
MGLSCICFPEAHKRDASKSPRVEEKCTLAGQIFNGLLDAKSPCMMGIG